MKIAEHVYKELEAVVGARNISCDPGILETYRCIACQSSAHYGPYKHKTPEPLAVVLPGSTAEVQQIVKLCNKYGMKFKASSTFWSSHGYVGCENAIQIDMRRMDKVEIDAKNHLAIVEPHAIAAMVQVEAMKHGLTPNVTGVGCSSSVLGNTAGWSGGGPISIYTGSGYENMMCAEWVLPNGEILTIGSAGSGDGWFCGEGPGLSLRGILRSSLGMAGELGVCTRMSVKLSPWHGPKVLETEGTVPAYTAKLPDTIKAYAIGFSSWEGWAQSVMDFWDNEILYVGHRQFAFFGRNLKGAMFQILVDPDKQLCDIPALLEGETAQQMNESLKRELYIVLEGVNEADLAYKEHILDQILEKNGGWRDPYMMQPVPANWLLLYLIRMGHKNLNYTMCGGYEGHFGFGGGNPKIAAAYIEEAAALKREWEEKDDFIVAGGGDSALAPLGRFGGGGFMGWEFFAPFDPHDDESVRKTAEYFKNVSDKWCKEKGFGGCFGLSNANLRRPDGYEYSQEEQNEIYSKNPNPQPFIYQWKVNEALNPNHLNSSYYGKLDPRALEK